MVVALAGGGRPFTAGAVTAAVVGFFKTYMVSAFLPPDLVLLLPPPPPPVPMAVAVAEEAWGPRPLVSVEGLGASPLAVEGRVPLACLRLLLGPVPPPRLPPRLELEAC